MQITCHISNFLFKDGIGGVSGRTVGSLMSTACDRCPETLNVVASKVEATAVLPQKGTQRRLRPRLLIAHRSYPTHLLLTREQPCQVVVTLYVTQ
ncbi:hypothetical protein B296_00045963 [Ensete ventricosum]|uniref:Uncharacterized protein n=1 Tax=Ensete ventricosum TaxID=4639 RepID=A0A426Z5L4_ENSVE|nr:hypothetical protein B296_00045963 [Ensete ventricosum]